MLAFDRKVFAARLSIARKKRELKQNALAKTSKMSPQMISDYENDRKMPSLEYAYNLACALDVPLDWLCGREGVEIADITAEKRNTTQQVGAYLFLLTKACDAFGPACEFSEDGCISFTFGPVVKKLMEEIHPLLDWRKNKTISVDTFDKMLEGVCKDYNKFSFEEAQKNPVREALENGKEE